MLFYLRAPRSAFVARGRVASKPVNDDGRLGWPGYYMARIEHVRLLRRPVSLAEAKAVMPAWGWLTQPRRSVEVPTVVVPRLERLLATERPYPVASVSALEGIRSEMVRLSRSRSRFLRDLALANASGTCECCGRQFALLGRMGTRVLQVHHRRPLSTSKVPRRTQIADLAVLCANCHVMVHADSRKVAAVGTVRRRLLSASSRNRIWAVRAG